MAPESALKEHHGRRDFYDRIAGAEKNRGVLSLINVAIRRAIENGDWVRQGGVDGTHVVTQFDERNGLTKHMSLQDPSFKVNRGIHSNQAEILDIDASGKLLQIGVKEGAKTLIEVDLDPRKAHRDAIKAVKIFGSTASNLAYHDSPKLFPGADLIAVDTSDNDKIKSRVVVNRKSHSELRGRGEHVYPTVGQIEYGIDHANDGKGIISEVVVRVNEWSGQCSEGMGSTLLLVAKKNPQGKYQIYRRDYKPDEDGILTTTEIPGHTKFKQEHEDVLVDAEELRDKESNQIRLNVSDAQTGHTNLEFKFVDGTEQIGETYYAALHPINSLKALDKAQEYVAPLDY